MVALPVTSIAPTQGVHAALDELARLDPGELSAAGQGELLVELKRIESRVSAYKLQVLAAAEKAKTAQRCGDADTASWASKHTREDGRDTSRQTKLANDLTDPGPTQQALAEGEISQGHAEAIVHTKERLPEELTPAERNRIEEDLVEKAKRLSPSALRQRGRRALEAIEKNRERVDAHEEAQVADEEERARARTRLSIRDNHDGTVSGYFTVPVFHGHLLRKILQTITAPRRANNGGSNGNGGDGATSGSTASAAHGTAAAGTEGSSDQESSGLSDLPNAARVAEGRRADWANAHGLALCELIEHLPTDHLSPKTAATIVVTLDEQVLRGRLAAAGLDTGEKISAAQARQLACNSGLVPVVLGGKSQPLDLGRSARIFSESQRTALATQYNQCAANGCERPYAWCELHHLKPWSKGGHTDLDQAVPLCHRHHRLIHDHRYHHARSPDGTITFTFRQ